MATEKRLISLDEAIARIKDDGILGNGYSDDERIDDVIDMLECCHEVEARPVVHGEWRLGKFNCGRETVFAECSVCDAVFEVSSFSLNLNYNYCPNCGAKMDGGADNG